MAKSAIKREYSAKRPKTTKSSKKVYDCDDVERYLDKAILSIKGEILPKIENLDYRDKNQFTIARKLIMDANAINESRQDNMEKTIESMHTTLSDSLDKFHTKLDEHIQSETSEFESIKQRIEIVANHAESIQNILDNVSANGNKGLSASFTDVYNKLKEMEKITAGARAREHFWISAKEVMNTSWFMFPFKSKIGAIIAVAIFLLVLNSILHAINVDMNVQSILNWAVSTFGKKG